MTPLMTKLMLLLQENKMLMLPLLSKLVMTRLPQPPKMMALMEVTSVEMISRMENGILNSMETGIKTGTQSSMVSGTVTSTKTGKIRTGKTTRTGKVTSEEISTSTLLSAKVTTTLVNHRKCQCHS